MTTLIYPRTGINYLEHQETGIRWMLQREEPSAPLCRGGILADDMGLGKTFQTIGLLKNTPTPGPTLIVCPPALIAGWKEELMACGYGVCMLIGPGAWGPATHTAKTRGTEDDQSPQTVWLTTYPKLCNNQTHISRSNTWVRIILDEGHIIRNGKSNQTWCAAMAIAGGMLPPHDPLHGAGAEKKGPALWILSATPIQNGLRDWRNLCAWLRVDCKPTEMDEIGSDIMLRRTMDDLRDDIEALPAAPVFVEHELHIPDTGPTAAEGRMFRAIRDQLDNALSSRGVDSCVILELYLRMQQFIVHPQIYIESMRTKFKGAYPRPDWTTTTTKWTAVMEELQRGVTESVGQIVFCMFRQELEMAEAEAKAMGASVFTVCGGMGYEKIGAAVSDARAAAAEGKPVVMVVQIVSGGVGLNLQFCERIHFLSQHWNPAVVHQAVGRAVRIGQKAVVQVHMYRIADALLENIDALMISKHLKKIETAKDICDSLYDGFAPLTEPDLPAAPLAAAAGGAAIKFMVPVMDADVAVADPTTVDPTDPTDPK